MCSEMKNGLLFLIPSLRAFAFCFTQDRSKADELVHSSLIQIWSNHAGTKSLDLKIVAFHATRRRFLRQGTPDPFPAFDLLAEDDTFTARFAGLPRTEREALSLVEAWGFSPSQASGICDCDREMIDRRFDMAHCHLTQNRGGRSSSVRLTSLRPRCTPCDRGRSTAFVSTLS